MIEPLHPTTRSATDQFYNKISQPTWERTYVAIDPWTYKAIQDSTWEATWDDEWDLWGDFLYNI